MAPWSTPEAGGTGVDLVEQLAVCSTMIHSRPFTIAVMELRPREGDAPAGRPAVIDRTHPFDARDDGGAELAAREDHTASSPGCGRSAPDLNPSSRQFCAGLQALCEGRVSRLPG